MLAPFARTLLIITLFLFIPVAIMAPHGVVWEIVIGGLVGVYYSRQQPLFDLPRSLTFILLCIPTWALITALWAQHPLLSLLMSLKIFVLLIFGIYWCRLTLSLSQPDKQSLIKALIAGLLLGLIFLLTDLWAGNPWHLFLQKTPAKVFAQGSLLISLAAWPIGFWILRQSHSLSYRLGGVLVFLTLLCLTLFSIDCDTSFVGLFAGIAVFLGILVLPRMTSWGLRLGALICIATFPFMSLYAFKPDLIPTYNHYIHVHSYIHRLYVWHETATLIFENPSSSKTLWRGIGMDETRHHPKAHTLCQLSYADGSGNVHRFTSACIPLHPHNAILQLWLELGLPGFILGILLAYQILSLLFQTALSSQEKATGAGLFTAAFLVVWVNLGFWQTWWISGLWIIVGLTICLFKGKENA